MGERTHQLPGLAAVDLGGSTDVACRLERILPRLRAKNRAGDACGPHSTLMPEEGPTKSPDVTGKEADGGTLPSQRRARCSLKEGQRVG